jgi:hypothetical protein
VVPAGLGKKVRGPQLRPGGDASRRSVLAQ